MPIRGMPEMTMGFYRGMDDAEQRRMQQERLEMERQRGEREERRLGMAEQRQDLSMENIRTEMQGRVDAMADKDRLAAYEMLKVGDTAGAKDRLNKKIRRENKNREPEDQIPLITELQEIKRDGKRIGWGQLQGDQAQTLIEKEMDLVYGAAKGRGGRDTRPSEQKLVEFYESRGLNFEEAVILVKMAKDKPAEAEAKIRIQYTKEGYSGDELESLVRRDMEAIKKHSVQSVFEAMRKRRAAKEQPASAIPEPEAQDSMKGKINRAPSSPYAEGTLLEGKDGMTYIVRDGKPVPYVPEK